MLSCLCNSSHQCEIAWIELVWFVLLVCVFVSVLCGFDRTLSFWHHDVDGGTLSSPQRFATHPSTFDCVARYCARRAAYRSGLRGFRYQREPNCGFRSAGHWKCLRIPVTSPSTPRESATPFRLRCSRCWTTVDATNLVTKE